MGYPAIHLTDDVAEALERLARLRDIDPAVLANEALREWLADSTEIAREVEAGVADIKAGRVVAHERVREWIERPSSARDDD